MVSLLLYHVSLTGAQFEKNSVKIEELGDKVVVTFDDGTTATADTVVCCDGSK